MTDRPAGAISEAERLILAAIHDDPKKYVHVGWHLVEIKNCLLISPVHEKVSFCFQFGANKGYYFKNYWLAYAYWLRLKAEKGANK